LSFEVNPALGSFPYREKKLFTAPVLAQINPV